MGPLDGLTILELAGIGPGPFCGMMLADMGAEVIRIERASANFVVPDPLQRSRKSIALNLKSPEAVAVLLNMVEQADGLFEGFRPGVAERLGLGPEDCLGRNPKLVYGRVTGWGQDGPLAQAAGHDLNYIALSGALHAIGRAGEKPVPPLNLVGDFGGGGMLLAYGMVCGLLRAERTGQGDVIDAAMVDGTLAQMAMFFGFRAMGNFDEQTGTHFLSGAAHYYDTYQTKDGKFVSIASLEPQFYVELIERAGLDSATFADAGFRNPFQPGDLPAWATLKAELAAVIATKTQAQWCELLEGTDVCFAPVLTTTEAAEHPHNQARRATLEVDGVLQGAPAPRFHQAGTHAPTPPPSPGSDTKAVLERFGFSKTEIDGLAESGALS